MDKKKKGEVDHRIAWNKEHCTRVSLNIRNDSGIPEALERVKIAGYSINSYVLKALREQLLDDGFM